MKSNRQATGAPGSKTQKPDPETVVQISLTMPQGLLDKIDALAHQRYLSRAALIKGVMSKAVKVA